MVKGYNTFSFTVKELHYVKHYTLKLIIDKLLQPVKFKKCFTRNLYTKFTYIIMHNLTFDI